MTEVREELVEPRYNHEVLTVVDNFEGALSRIMISRYGLKSDALGTIHDITERYKDRKPFDKGSREIADSLAKPLSNLVGPESFIDAQPNLFYGALEVEISKAKKGKPKEVLTTGGELWGYQREGRGSRADLLVIGPGRMEFKKPGIEIDCYDSSADPMKVPKGSLSVVANDASYGIPYGKIVIDAEEQSHHRDHVRIVAIENGEKHSNPMAVYASDHLGVEAYYDEKGRFKSLGIYFKEGERSIFGTYIEGKSAFHFIGNQKELGVDDTELPLITLNGGKIIIERSGVRYTFDQTFDFQAVLDKVLAVLGEEEIIET